MNVRKYVYASLVVFVVLLVLDILIHTVILAGTYKATEPLWRPEAEMRSMRWIFWVVTLVFAFVFVYIYGKGYEGKGLVEGVRFGFWIGLLTSVPMAFASYAMYHMPFSLALWWFMLGMVRMILAGLVTAALYKPEPRLA